MKTRMNLNIDSGIVADVKAEAERCKINITAMSTLLFTEALEARKRNRGGQTQK